MEINYSNSGSVATITLATGTAEKFDRDAFFASVLERELRVIVIRNESGSDFDLGDNEVAVKGRLDSMAEQIARCSVPVIASVRNRISRSGLSIVRASHICICSEDSIFETEDTFRPDLSPSDARSNGWVNKVVPGDQVKIETDTLVDSILKLAPIAVKFCLQAVEQGIEKELKDGLATEIELFGKIFSTEDMREGTSAFLEKRNPVFKGK